MSESGPSPGDVGVLIAARDARSTIDAALASVAAQTHAPGKVVLVDDGSTDGTAERARRWEELLPLEVIHLDENVGLASARHEAALAADAPFLTVLDADDIWLPEHLAGMTALAGDDAVVASQLVRWVPELGVGAAVPPEWRSVPAVESQLRELYRANYVGMGLLVSRARYDAVGGYRAGLRRSEDWDIALRLVRAGARLVRPSVATYLYRASGSNLSFGQSNAEADVEVLEHAVAESVHPEEREWAQQALERRRARLQVVDAFSHARGGDRAGARREALAAVRRGDGRTRAQAALLLLSPERAVSWRDARNMDAGRLLAGAGAPGIKAYS